MKGYLYLWRKLGDSALWLSEPFTRGQALADLLMLASHKDNYFRVRGVRVDVKRGQLAWSQLRLAERWKWSRGKVRRFLKELESKKESKIVQQNNKVTTLITIINYDYHQNGGTTDGHQTDIKRTSNGTHTINVKNVNKKDIAFPDWINKPLWKEFKKYRTMIKSPLTPHAEKLCLADLVKLVDNGENQTAVINQTIKSGKWKSFYPDKSPKVGSVKKVVKPLACPECGCDWSNVQRGSPCPQCHGIIPIRDVSQLLQNIGGTNGS